MINATDMLPCPWCGQKDWELHGDDDEWMSFRCCNCGAESPPANDEAISAKLVNQRVTGVPEVPLRVMQNLERQWYEALHDRDLWHAEARRLRAAMEALGAKAQIGEVITVHDFDALASRL